MPVFDCKTTKVMVPPDMSGLLLCTDGNAKLRINGIVFKFSRGILCLVGPFLFIEIISESDDCKWEMICDDKDVFHPVSIYLFDIIGHGLLKHPCLTLDEKQIERFLLFVDMLKDKRYALENASDRGDSAMFRHNIVLLEQTAAMEFITRYCQELSRLTYKANGNETIVFNFIDLLNQNYALHRDVAWYAKQANLSPAHFTNIVHKYTGYTPVLMIKHIIVANAKILLLQHELSIKEIAIKLNFSNQFVFSRYFKSCAGMSPNEYRATQGF